MLKFSNILLKPSNYTCRFIATKAAPSKLSIKKNKEFSKEGLSALQSRLNLQFKDPNLLEVSLTHKSYRNQLTHSNQNLQWIGKKVIGLYTGEYLDSIFPNLQHNFINDIQQYYFGVSIMAQYAKNLGLQFLIRWVPSSELNDLKVGETKILGQALQALVGAIYLDNGPNAAKEFIHKHFMSQRIDPTQLVNFDSPILHLKLLCRRKNLDAPVSRLLKETGRYTSSPVFIVGMFSGVDKIGEGFGSSLAMAEFRSARNALMNYYTRQETKFTLPSVTEDPDYNSKYTPAFFNNKI
ncbi:hypothetical protein BB561_001832 [Smittium simulii]|uniref:Large ribosomal subunit protein mL44 n=1 Tax=Smittium simulii TaxID=133385 RepID=A0A2T9YSV4_9FUNG|nr:hypothetical protein BB561_001832 [Smittium simulii]